MNKKNYKKISLTTLFILSIFIIPSFSLAITSNTLSNGLMGHWTLDGSYVTDKIYDTSGQNNHGYFYNGATTTAKVSGRVGGAMSFDGVDDYIKIGTAGSGTFNYSIVTVSAWVKRTAAMASFDGIVTSELNTSHEKGWALVGNSSNQVYFATNSDAWYESSRYTLPLNEWHHITGVFNGSTNTLYVDGVIVGTSNPAAISYTGSRAVAPAIGVYPENTYLFDEYFPGLIDDVRIYNRALSATEIKQLYQLNASRYNTTPTQPLTSGLVGHWTMDGKDTNWLSSTVGTTTDRSGNGNTGTMTNMSRSTAQVLGKIGQAMKFDGVNDYMETNYVFPTTNFSFSFWAKSASYGIANRTFGNADALAGLSGVDVIWGYPYNHLYIVTRQGANVGTYDVNVTVLNLHVGWHHVSVTVDSSLGAKVYYDGQLAGSNALSTVITSSLTTRIGRDGNGTDAFNGSVDDVRIYNRALSATEIKQLYNLAASKYNTTPTQPLTSGLVGHWTMDGKDTPWTSSTAGTVVDRSGNGNTGTMTNMNRSTAQVLGKIGQGMKFDGVDDHVVRTMSGTSLTELTISFWTKTLGANDATQRGVFQWAGGLSSTAPFVLIARESSTSDYKLYVDGNYMIDCSISNNVWTHYLVKLDSNNLWTVYKDGVSCGTYQDDATHTNQSGATNVYLGNGYNGYFAGSLDDVRIYNRALSATEIKQLYNLGR